MTKLERFIQKHSLRPTDIALLASYSRRHLFYLRMGRTLPSLHCADAIRQACQQLSGKRVEMLDLFDLSTAAERKRA